MSEESNQREPIDSREARLWAPWRLSYVKGDEARASVASTSKVAPAPLLPNGEADCFLCRAAAGQSLAADRESLVVHRHGQAMTLLNRYPYNNGHLLVAPLTHKAGLGDLSHVEQADLHSELVRMMSRITRRMNAEGFNVGLNLGRVAGAGVPGHLHWHIVPRWNGDNNFMPTLAQTRVMSQALEAAWETLSAEEDLA